VSRGGFDNGILAAALIGLMRAGGSQPDARISARAGALVNFADPSAELTRIQGSDGLGISA
jgi:hypothetical protein